MTIGMILFCVVIILGLIAIVRYLQTAGGYLLRCGATAEELLAARFARGEIDEQEYRRRLDALRGEPGPVIRH